MERERRRITIVRNGQAEVMEFGDLETPVVVQVRPRPRRVQLMPALFVVLAAATLALLAGLTLFVG